MIVKIEKEITIALGEIKLGAFLTVPKEAKGIVLFAHGSGSSRKSPRNRFVARYLEEENIATLLFDLLTEEEGVEDMQTAQLRFNIPFLADRLLKVTDYVYTDAELKRLSIGYFGASTGSAAALIAASKNQNKVKAVVSRGGRPDLATDALPHVKAPTLFIVGGQDTGVIELNRSAFALLSCHKKFEIVEGATHLFEERGAMDHVCNLAAHWFNNYL